PAAERGEPFLRVAVGGQRRRVAEPALERRELAVQLPDLAEGGAEQVVDREVRARRLLGQVADPVPRSARVRDPPGGASPPASSRSSVVLPAPLGPTRPTRRSPESVTLRPSKIVLSPYSAR